MHKKKTKTKNKKQKTKNKKQKNKNTDSTKKFYENDIINMLVFLSDSMLVMFCGPLFQQTVGTPMGTICAPLLADLFFYLCEVDFIQRLLKKKGKKLARSFYFTFRYIDNVFH